MFGGPHHSDAVTWAEQFGWSEKNRTTIPGESLAARSAAAPTEGCLQKNQKPYQIALDTADFVRHVPWLPWLRDTASRSISERLLSPGPRLAKRFSEILPNKLVDCVLRVRFIKV